MSIYQEGTPAPKAEEVKKSEEIVRKVVFDTPGRHEVFHLCAKVEKVEDALHVDLGNE